MNSCQPRLPLSPFKFNFILSLHRYRRKRAPKAEQSRREAEVIGSTSEARAGDHDSYDLPPAGWLAGASLPSDRRGVLRGGRKTGLAKNREGESRWARPKEMRGR